MMDAWTMRLSSHSAAAFSGKQHHSRLPCTGQAPSRLYRDSQQRQNKKHKLVAHTATTDVADKREQYNKSMSE